MLRLVRQRQGDIPLLALRQANAAADGEHAIDAGLGREAIVMGGFVSGMFVGTVVVLGLGAALSLSMPLTQKPEVADAAPEPAAVKAPAPVAELTDGGKDADLVELPPTAPEPVGEQTDTLAELADVEIEPDSQPQLDEAAVKVDAPVPFYSTEVSVSTEAPLAPQAPPLVQSSPEVDGLPDVSLEVPRSTAGKCR